MTIDSCDKTEGNNIAYDHIEEWICCNRYMLIMPYQPTLHFVKKVNEKYVE